MAASREPQSKPAMTSLERDAFAAGKRIGAILADGYRRLLVGLLLLAVAVGGCGGAAAPSMDPPPGDNVIEGAFTLFDPGDIYINRGSDGIINHCTGTGGYDDVEPGLQVVVRDGGGEVLGTGELAYDDDAYRATERECTLVFEVHVPEVEFYTVAVGTRGELTYSLAELEAADWQIAAELGG